MLNRFASTKIAARAAAFRNDATQWVAGVKVRRNEKKEQKARRLFGLGIATHVFLWIAAGLIVVTLTLFLFWLSFDKPHLQSQAAKGVGPAALFNAAKLALAVVAGIGGVVALVVAFRRQRLGEADHERQERATSRDETRLFTERFAQATEQLGSDQAAVRVAGVYALAGLADDWTAGRQTCVDVLCAYLRMPFRLRSPLPEYEPELEEDRQRFESLRTAIEALDAGRMTYPASEEYQVRSTILRAMRDRMNEYAEVQWSGLNLDFTGAIFDEASFDSFIFDQCDVQFGGCIFVGGASFAQSKILGSRLWFTGAVFLGRIGFEFAHISDSELTLYGDFGHGGDLNFQGCELESGSIDILGPRNGRGHVSFVSSFLKGGDITFSGPEMAGNISIAFSRSAISGTSIKIQDGTYSGGNFWFNGITLQGGHIEFRPRVLYGSARDRMRLAGTEFAFDAADIQGGSIRFGFLDVDGSAIHFDDLEMTGGAIRFVDVVLRSGAVTMKDADVTGGSIDLGGIAETPAGQTIASTVGEFLRPVAPLGESDAEVTT